MSVNIQKAMLAVIAVFLIAVAACSNSTAPEPTATPIPIATAITPTVENPTESSPSLAPVFSVSNIDGKNVRLEYLLGTVPVYLVFIPSTRNELDITQLEQIQSRMEQFKEMNAEVVVVVSELPTQVINARDEFALDFSLIADPIDVLANDWQVFDLDNDGESNPASFVFDAHGNLVARLVAAEPNDRPSIDEVLSVIGESLSVGAA
jgi:peroxiredoxin